MKLADLKFDNANNAALSLRVLAEQVRTGEVKMFDAENWDKPENIPGLLLGFKEPGAR
jgi:hypothetical protein